MARNPKASAGTTSRIHILAGMLVDVLHYDKSELRALVESKLKPQVVHYLEVGLRRRVTREDAYHLHNGLDPGLDPVTFVYAGVLRQCVLCEDHDYSDGSCKDLIHYLLAFAQYRLADTIRKGQRYARRGAGPAAAMVKAKKTDKEVLAQWDKLEAMRPRYRATKISTMLKMPVTTVRDSIKRLKKAGKIK